MRPLRVAYLVASPRAGGAENQMIALAERLPKDRFDVEFVGIAGAADYHPRILATGAQIRSLGEAPPPESSLASRVARRAVKAARFVRVVHQRGYHIVDAWLYPADILAAFARPLTRTPIVVAGRRNMGDLDGRLGSVQRRINSTALRGIDAVVANSAAVAAEAIAREHVEPRKLRVIRNGVELIEPLSPADRQTRREALGAGEADFLIGCIANYRPVKRLDLLIDALAAVASQRPAVRLVLIGDGELRDVLQAQVDRLGMAKRVRLYGIDLDPRRLYGAFDLVVQPSGSEGLPNAMLEASAAGRPIVATAAGGTGEIVIDGQTGLLVPVNDTEALAVAMLRAVDDEQLRSRLGVAARIHVERTFGMQRYVDEFAALYERLAEAKGLR